MMTQMPGRRKSSLYLPAAPAPRSPAPTASTKDKDRIVPTQCGPPPGTPPFPPPAPRLQNSVADTDAGRTTSTEPSTTLPSTAPPATAARQMTHNLAQACATSKACRRLYPAGSATFRCQVQTAGFATATIPRPAWHSPQFQLQPTLPRRSSANPRALRVRTLPARTAPRHPPATSEAANTRGTCSTPGWSRWQKISAPFPPKSSTANASARQNHFPAACRSCLRPNVRAILLPQSSPPPANTGSTGTTTPDAASNTALQATCCNPVDTVSPGISENVHLRNKTRKSLGARRYPDSATPPERATARRSPKIMPALKRCGTPATAAILP